MTLPKISEGVTRKTLPDDEEVLMNASGGTALIVNATGAAVFDLCDGKRTTAEIASFIVKHIPSAKVEAVQVDVERIIGELQAAGLVEAS